MNTEMITRLNKVLSFGELQCCRILFDEMKLDTAMNAINCMKLADKWDMHKATFNSALRFLEIAGFISFRSMGCKGVVVRFTDKKSYEELVKDILV